MIGRRRSPLRRHALRTAALGTLVVGVGLGAALVATDLLVSNLLTGAVDHRLLAPIDEIVPAGRTPVIEAASRHDFDQPIFTWTVLASGACRAAGAAPTLPADVCPVTSPMVVTVAGSPFRLIDRRLPSGQPVVVGTSLAPVASLMGDLVIAELAVAPLLLLAVFLGALAIGTRVGAAAERMRQRQLALTADASHELRTPLTVIQAETNLALAGEDRSLRASMALVSEEVGRMRHVVEDLLWLARFDSQPEPPPPVVLDVVTTARVGAERFRALAAGRSVSISVEAPDDVLAVAMPAEWMDRLIGVLMDNACRHARTRITVQVRAVPGRHVELAVSDDGDGIPDGAMARIFDRFHRATPRGEGAGLGLAIADTVVRAARGRWEVTNLASGGARFAVGWPAAGADGPTPLATSRSRALGRFRGRAMGANSR